MALFQWASALDASQRRFPLLITLADYNPSVLHLVTLPNFLLAWALHSEAQGQPLLADGELELTQDVKDAFQRFLTATQISLSFVSGGWSPAFVDVLYSPSVVSPAFGEANTAVLGAETIYSPFALSLFVETVLCILNRERAQRPGRPAVAVVAAKKLYFGVGGSLDDFVNKMRGSGAVVHELREETEGVRRGVVQCLLA